MNDDGTRPGSGDFEDPSLPLKVIMVFVADGGWHLQTVLVRVRAHAAEPCVPSARTAWVVP